MRFSLNRVRSLLYRARIVPDCLPESRFQALCLVFRSKLELLLIRILDLPAIAGRLNSKDFPTIHKAATPGPRFITFQRDKLSVVPYDRT